MAFFVLHLDLEMTITDFVSNLSNDSNERFFRFSLPSDFDCSSFQVSGSQLDVLLRYWFIIQTQESWKCK